MIDKFLKNEERAVFTLRALYEKYGYLPFKMSKFEEYELYSANKDFLVSDRFITFNDTNGRLLALKPDVTLSIIKNTVFEQGCKQKVYYNENVYRVSGSTHQFKEIMQTGLECIGDIDINDIFEVVYLGAKSLSLISDKFIIDLSDMGLLSAILSEISDSDTFKKEIIKLISEKNKHEALALCDRYSVCAEDAQRLIAFIEMYGKMSSVLASLDKICVSEGSRKAYDRLAKLCDMLEKTELGDKIRIDFSVVNDMNYYNGIVFKGFLEAIPESVLSGGEYGSLLSRMDRRGDAIGFAIYLDLLEALDSSRREYDVDALIIYSEKTDASLLSVTKEKLINEGKSVSAQRAIPSKLRYREIIDLTKEGNK